MAREGVVELKQSLATAAPVRSHASAFHSAHAYVFALTLLAVAFSVEMFAPFFIWKRFLPGSLRWLADLALLSMLALVVFQLLFRDRIPKAAIFVVAITAIWSTVAHFEGQGTGATLWGWWRLFRYPLLGLFVYLQPEWPPRTAWRIYQLSVGLLIFQTFFQLGQFAGGMIPSDDLAGTLGWHGVGPLGLFNFFVQCLAFGRFISDGDWKPLALVVGIGAVSAVLSELKMFFPVMIVLAGITSLIYLIQGRDLGRLLLFYAFFLVAGVAFLLLYNMLVSDLRGTRRIEEYFSSDTTAEYLENVNYEVTKGRFELGRGFAIRYGWQLIQRDPTSFLFGMGLGARGESRALGIVGSALKNGQYGVTSGTSALVFINEFGVVGLLVFGVFGLMVILMMIGRVRDNLEPPSVSLRIGLALFTIMWPVWLWYHQTWGFGSMMIPYWCSLGYVFHENGVRERSLAELPTQEQVA